MSAIKRQIVLDTETTGRETSDGNRVIEIGCLELVNRRITGKTFHQYINPERLSEAGALAVHGLQDHFLQKQPLFKAIVDDFLAFIKDSQLIIHNAPFDIGFLDMELQRVSKNYGCMADYCTVFDTLPLARQMHPGQRNSLDALCKRYEVNNSHRELHGALLDAELLAQVYLAMTGGQTKLFAEETRTSATTQTGNKELSINHGALRVITATEAELNAHQERLTSIDQASGGKCVWTQ